MAYEAEVSRDRHRELQSLFEKLLRGLDGCQELYLDTEYAVVHRQVYEEIEPRYREWLARLERRFESEDPEQLVDREAEAGEIRDDSPSPADLPLPNESTDEPVLAGALNSDPEQGGKDTQEVSFPFMPRTFSSPRTGKGGGEAQAEAEPQGLEDVCDPNGGATGFTRGAEGGDVDSPAPSTRSVEVDEAGRSKVLFEFDREGGEQVVDPEVQGPQVPPESDGVRPPEVESEKTKRSVKGARDKEENFLADFQQALQLDHNYATVHSEAEASLEEPSGSESESDRVFDTGGTENLVPSAREAVVEKDRVGGEGKSCREEEGQAQQVEGFLFGEPIREVEEDPPPMTKAPVTHSSQGTPEAGSQQPTAGSDEGSQDPKEVQPLPQDTGQNFHGLSPEDLQLSPGTEEESDDGVVTVHDTSVSSNDGPDLVDTQVGGPTYQSFTGRYQIPKRSTHPATVL